MTREELIKTLKIMVNFGGDPIEAERLLNDFFSQNVVIPKGATLQAKTLNIEWDDILTISDRDDVKYRIKPQEPIYEWQWDSKDRHGNYIYHYEGDKHFFTDDEIGQKANWLCKVEHTKRVRQ